MSRVVGNAPWAPRAPTRAVLEQVDKVLAEYRKQWPLTVRQVFYRLVGAHGFPKTELDYKRLQDYLNRARRSGRIEWAAIRDDGASSEDPSWRYTDDSPEDWLRWQLRVDAEDYRLHPMEGQPVWTEVWCEAGGMVPMLGRAVDEWAIPVYSGGGFDSVTVIRQHAQRHRYRSVPTRVIYVGDYDASGESMFHRYREDVTAFGSTATWVKVAVTAKHITTYELPTATPKPTDKRGVFTDTRTVQAEALPPDVLTRLVRKAVRRRWDASAAEAVLARQTEAREWLEDRLEALNRLFDLDDEDDEDGGDTA